MQVRKKHQKNSLITDAQRVLALSIACHKELPFKACMDTLKPVDE